jgi:hypothetical protein
VGCLALVLTHTLLVLQAWFRSRRVRTQRIRHADVTTCVACFILSIAVRARPCACGKPALALQQR